MKTDDTCPYCNSQIPSNSAFCVNCGRDLRYYEKPKLTEEKKQPEHERPVENCAYCQKSSPEGSKFCVHCGKEPQLKVNETPVSSSSKKLSSIFNILIFLAAIASIFGFIYFYVENKLSTPADKNPINEEIVDNLYRNTKYQFRIKFPETWEIKKGDGPNILVKATSGEGSSINIYVKDLGIELGDIDDLMTLDEWANSVNEKFPSAKIISKKEIYIDNRKAYFVQYSINYKALDQETDGIFYNVSLVNKNYNYAITAGSEESQFENEKQILDQSVRTFVIEEYGTNIGSQDQNSNFQSENAPTKKEKKKQNSVTANQPWFRNSLFGISFETPEKLEEQSSKPPVGYEEYITKFKSYFSKESELIVFFMYAESKFDSYDKKTGLNGAIGNMVNSMNGTDLSLAYSEPNTTHDDLECSGSSQFNGIDVPVRGCVYWNGKGKFFLLTVMGDKKDLKSMDKVIKSVRINIPGNIPDVDRDTDSKVLNNLKEGQWEGSAQQFNIRATWSIRLNYDEGTEQFIVTYPSLNCKGHWTITNVTDSQVEFTEFIDTGQNSCNNGGRIVLKSLTDRRMEYLYYWPDKSTLDSKGEIIMKE